MGLFDFLRKPRGEQPRLTLREQEPSDLKIGTLYHLSVKKADNNYDVTVLHTKSTTTKVDRKHKFKLTFTSSGGFENTLNFYLLEVPQRIHVVETHAGSFHIVFKREGKWQFVFSDGLEGPALEYKQQIVEVKEIRELPPGNPQTVTVMVPNDGVKVVGPKGRVSMMTRDLTALRHVYVGDTLSIKRDGEPMHEAVVVPREIQRNNEHIKITNAAETVFTFYNKAPHVAESRAWFDILKKTKDEDIHLLRPTDGRRMYLLVKIDGEWYSYNFSTIVRRVYIHGVVQTASARSSRRGSTAPNTPSLPGPLLSNSLPPLSASRRGPKKGATPLPTVVEGGRLVRGPGGKGRARRRTPKP